jgi:hypothetical protein
VRPQIRQVEETVDLAKHVIVGHVPLETEAVEQRLLHHPPSPIIAESLAPKQATLVRALLQAAELEG